ncbi:MAG: hypothetical protein ACXWQO_00315 [Bdellovibrionota bacterium]
MKHFRPVCLLLLLLVQGCAVAPLSNHITARTNGKGDSLLSAGSTIGVGDRGWVPSLKYSIGLSDNFDLGFQYEVVEYGTWGKYAFINNGEEGFSLAGLVGLGASFDGFYGYIGPIVSYKTGIFEPYFLTRFNYVHYPEQKFAEGTIGEITVRPGNYRYFQHTLGFFLWPVDWFGTGFEVSTFGTLNSPFILVGSDRLLLSANFSFRF